MARINNEYDDRDGIDLDTDNWPCYIEGCPNRATQWVSWWDEAGRKEAYCDEHAAEERSSAPDDDYDPPSSRSQRRVPPPPVPKDIQPRKKKHYKQPSTPRDNAAAIANPTHELFWSRRHLRPPNVGIQLYLGGRRPLTVFTRAEHFLGEGRTIQVLLVRKDGKWKASPYNNGISTDSLYSENLCAGCSRYAHCVSVGFTSGSLQCWFCRDCVGDGLE